MREDRLQDLHPSKGGKSQKQHLIITPESALTACQQQRHDAVYRPAFDDSDRLGNEAGVRNRRNGAKRREIPPQRNLPHHDPLRCSSDDAHSVPAVHGNSCIIQQLPGFLEKIRRLELFYGSCGQAAYSAGPRVRGSPPMRISC